MSLIRSARIRKGLTQAQLAEKLKIHGQSISNIERGISPLPGRHIKALSKILGISRKDLALIVIARQMSKLESM